MKVYCMMNGVIKKLTLDEQKELYKTQCLIKAENCLDAAQEYIIRAAKNLEASHKYD